MDALMNLERISLQWLVQSYQRRTLHRAVRQAYREFAAEYPHWVAVLFDEHFVNTHLMPLLHSAAERGDKVSPRQVAELWVRQISLLPSQRQKHSAAILPAATRFLSLLADALSESQVVDNAPALVEIGAG
jgi:hypothetical protein